MTRDADRRTVLTGLAALGVAGCDRVSVVKAVPAVEAEGPQPRRAPIAFDLSALEARHDGRLGFVAYDVGADARVAWRGDERFVYCSTFKMYLAAGTLLRVQAGEESLDRAVPVTAADMINHAPVTEPAVGETLTIERLMEATVGLSDNPAANILIRELGGLDQLRAFYRGIGDTDTRVDRLEPEMNRLDGDKDTITPARSAQNIERLFVRRDTPLTAASRTLLLGWMFATPTGPNRLKAGLPADWRLAHKTGTGGYGPTNDIGLAWPPSGEPLIIAAYFHGSRTSTEQQREAAIADATRMALAALGYA